LPRHSNTGFVEFFTSLYQAHPNLGRQRSVFGGLWTDRTDARAVLKGRISVGQISKDAATPLEQLILDGFTIVPTAPLTPADEPPTELLLATMNPAMLNILEAAFDDHAIILRTELVQDSRPPLQPSAGTPSPSPAECMLLIAPVGDRPVLIDVVRSSHLLPEFTAEGRSRWIASPTPQPNGALLEDAALVDRVELAPGMAALVGAGTIHAVHIPKGASALRALLVPSRCMPLGTPLNAATPDRARDTPKRPRK
jgi:hypothetical protein